METPMTTETSAPADWDLTNPTTWNLSQAVNAHMGYHETGMVMREVRDVTYRATDLDDGDIAESIAQGQDPAPIAAWWYDVLDGMLAGAIAIAEASPEEIDAAMASLGITEWHDLDADDLEQDAANGRKIAAALVRDQEAFAE